MDDALRTAGRFLLGLVVAIVVGALVGVVVLYGLEHTFQSLAQRAMAHGGAGHKVPTGLLEPANVLRVCGVFALVYVLQFVAPRKRRR